MKIELGQKYDSACCAPTGANETKDKVSYPSLYFTHDKPVELPDEGTAVITFRKIESSENVRDPEDPKYRCEIEVRSIEVKGGKKSGGEDMGSVFKKNLDRKMMKGEYEEEG